MKFDVIPSVPPHLKPFQEGVEACIEASPIRGYLMLVVDHQNAYLLHGGKGQSEAETMREIALSLYREMQDDPPTSDPPD